MNFFGDLFSDNPEQPTNLLHKDGTVNYYGPVMSSSDANTYLTNLLSQIAWQNDQVIVLGKPIVTKRKVAWYGDEPFEYTYSNTTKTALAWTKDLLSLKAIVEQQSGEKFNSCLLNLYHTGTEGMAWHSDNEHDLKKHGAIASLSFGAERKFSFKHKQSKETVSLFLQHGSLLIMKDNTQTHWLHSLPPTKTVLKPRVNLTFRTIMY